MQSTKAYIRNLFFNLGFRITTLVIFVICSVFLLTQTAVKAHSESDDVKYRQISVFSDAGLSASAQYKAANNISYAQEIDEDVSKIEMSYDIDQVTPTPTPVINIVGEDIWLKLAECESHQNWKSDTGNGYYGGLQFSLGAWASVGGQGKPSDASAEEQIAKAKLLQQRRGWGPWGGCSKKLGFY